ncbi:unnamed protein product [Orchesella dallaii]|uniref:Uncharacterized protein n=1 Tax=Orchesella dallaii TaxID=48710 RepID=A0ABP1RLF3_9HEXA
MLNCSVGPDSLEGLVFPAAIARSETCHLYNTARHAEGLYARQISKENLDRLELAHSHSRVLPSTLKTLKKVCDDVVPSSLKKSERDRKIKGFYDDDEIMYEATVKSFNKWQKTETLEILKPCDRTAAKTKYSMEAFRNCPTCLKFPSREMYELT